jgi:microcystin-dependent protein
MRAVYWVGLLLTCVVTAGASVVPSSFNYQGVLRGGSGELLPAGTRNVEFRLYSQPTGGSALWGRGYAVMLDSNGLFNVTLTDGSGSQVSDPSAAGATIPQVIAAHSMLYLGVLVVGNTEIAPRQQLLSVPYALMAGDVKQSSGDVHVNGTLYTMNGVTAGTSIQAMQTLLVGNGSGVATLTASSTGDLQVPALDVNGNATVTGRIKDKTGYVMPVGSVLPYAGVSLPNGWLACDGSPVSRAAYPELFSALGVTYGAGDGSTTFNLPDLQGRTAIGAGQGTGLSNRTLAQKPGEETHRLLTTEMPSHSHTYTMGDLETYWGHGAYNNMWVGTGNSGTTGSAGGDVAHNNMQPSLVLKYIIKY